MIPVHIGYDSRETVAYSVMADNTNAWSCELAAIAPLMLNQLQQIQHCTRTPNKSSAMPFKQYKMPLLDPEYVDTVSEPNLHQFKWLEDESLIGEIFYRRKHLVGYDKPYSDVALMHYTLGNPYFTEFVDCEYAKKWFADRVQMLNAAQRKK